MSELPAGFKLDENNSKPVGIPAGFVLDGSGSTPKSTPQPKAEAHPTASKIMALASGADEAFLGIPGNIAAGLRSVTHGESFDQSYKTIKGTGKTSSENHPGYYAGGLVGGAVATLPLLPEAAPTVAGRAIQGAKIGAGMAGVSEFSDSKDIGKSAEAALAGGALGLVTSPALEGLTHVAVNNPIVSTARSAMNIEKAATNRVAGALRQDRALGGQGLSASEFMNARSKGDPVGIADLGGNTTRDLGRWAANHSPEGEQILKNLTENRFSNQAERVTDTIGSSGIANFDKREALKEAAKIANKPLYNKAYAYSANGLWNDSLANLVNAPDVAAAISGATKKGANRAVADGYKPTKNPFNIAQDGTVSLTQNQDGSIAKPTLEFWDSVKQNLDDKISSLQRSGEKGAAADAIALKNKLVEQLDAENPYYKKARGTASTFFGATDAVDAGAKFVSSKMDLAEVRKNLAGMSTPERKLFSDGFATEFINKINSISDRRDVVNQIYNSPAAREKIELALGKGQAKQLEAQLHVEQVMNQFKQAIGGNSTTAKQLFSATAWGTAGATGSYLSGNDTTLGGAGGLIYAVGRGRVDAAVAKKVAEMLVSNKPEQLKIVTKMVANNEKLMNVFRKLSIGASSETGRTGGDYYGSKR